MKDGSTPWLRAGSRWYSDFHDLRVAGDLNWTQPVGIGNKLSVGAHLSKEYDFISASANGMFSHDFNNKNTTLGMGASAEFDQVKAVGGTPVAGTSTMRCSASRMARRTSGLWRAARASRR